MSPTPKAWPILSAALLAFLLRRIAESFFLPPGVGEGGRPLRKQRHAAGRGVLLSFAAFVLLALLIAPTHAADTLTGASAPDSTYGDGGTKETFLDSSNVLRAEIWRDANGMIREQHEIDGSGEQFWGFFIGEGTASYNWGGAIAIKPISGPSGAWTMTVYGTGTVTIKEYGFLTKAELDTEFAHWRTQMRGWVNGFIRAYSGNG
jgi:hypothetical protein